MGSRRFTKVHGGSRRKSERRCGEREAADELDRYENLWGEHDEYQKLLLKFGNRFKSETRRWQREADVEHNDFLRLVREGPQTSK